MFIKEFNNKDFTSIALFHVRHAQLHCTNTNGKMENTCIMNIRPGTKRITLLVKGLKLFPLYVKVPKQTTYFA